MCNDYRLEVDIASIMGKRPASGVLRGSVLLAREGR